MFIFCEPIALGMEHVPFNAAFIKTICFAFPNDKVIFYAEKAHLNFIREQINHQLKDFIIWREITIPPRHSKFFSRVISDFRTVKNLLDKLNVNPKKDVLVITGIAPILWALKYYTRNEHRNKNVQVVIHGDFSTLHRTPRRGLLNPIYHIGCLKTALRLPGYERIQHIVLEETVRNGIVKYMPFLRQSVHVFDHPIPVDEIPYEEDSLNTSLDLPIQFGFLGRATEKKGFSKYLEVAAEISKMLPGEVKFHFIGRITEKLRLKHLSEISFLSGMPENDNLTRSDYVDRLRRLHFVCLFYNNYYEFCASGALLDSIAGKKPIIANNLELFRVIQNKYGDIGYLCEEKEFRETIRSIVQTKDFGRYNRQVLNMSNVKASRTPRILSKRYIELVRLLKQKSNA